MNLLEQLENVLETNCQNMLVGNKGTRCIDSMLDILFELHKKNQLPDALPLLEKYLKTDDYTDFNQLHPHLLRAVVLNLDNYVRKYNKGFLINLFMNMEEHAITGIYFLKENGKFADNKLMEEFQKYTVFPIVFNEMSNTAIIMMLNSKKKVLILKHLVSDQIVENIHHEDVPLIHVTLTQVKQKETLHYTKKNKILIKVN